MLFKVDLNWANFLLHNYLLFSLKESKQRPPKTTKHYDEDKYDQADGGADEGTFLTSIKAGMKNQRQNVSQSSLINDEHKAMVLFGSLKDNLKSKLKRDNTTSYKGEIHLLDLK